MSLTQHELSILVRARDEVARALAAVPPIPDDVWESMMLARKEIERAWPVLERFASDIGTAAELTAGYRAAISPLITVVPLTLRHSPPTMLRSPAYLTSGLSEPVYVPEDDPCALQEELAEKDERIAELEAELRAVHSSLALGGMEYPDDLEPEDFSEN